MAKENSREEAEELAYLQAMYGQQYEALTNEIASFTLSNNALRRNIEVLERLPGMKGSKILLSGEGGTYINASIDAVGSVMTYVGAGYFVDKGVADALEFLKKNELNSAENLKRMAQQREQVEREIFKVNYRISLMQQQQGQ